MTYRFEELVDVRTLSKLLASLHQATGLPSIVLDQDGRVLASAGGIPVCSRICHCPACSEAGGKSAGASRLSGCNTRNADASGPGEGAPAVPCRSIACRRGAAGFDPPAPGEVYYLFRCPKGVCDVMVPVVVEGGRIATFHLGQFFAYPPDKAVLREQARQQGLEPDEFLALMDRIPVIEPSRVSMVMDFYARLATSLAEQGLKRLRLAMAEDALERSERRYKRLLASVTNAIYTVRLENDRIVSVTHGPGCESVTGYGPEAFESDPLLWTRLVHSQDRQRVIRYLEQILRGQTPEPLEHRLLHKDGSLRWVRNIPVVLRGPAGEVQLFEGLIQDITSQKRLEELMQADKTRAEKASSAKSEFLANMSHEIRTPMNAILGLTQLALKRELTAETREFLEGAMEAGGALLGIINDILDFSKIEAHRMELTTEDFDLKALLDQVSRTLGIQAKRKGISLDLEIAPGLPARVRGDAARIRQVLLNMVGNAVKFTHHGGVTIRAGLASREQGGGTGAVWLLVSVQDTGIGIPEDRLESIFEMFEQAGVTTSRHYGGSGLGLTISRRLAAMMGGRLWAQSIEGKGSTFYCTLRLEKGLENGGTAALATELLRKAESEVRNLRILLVEDDPMNQVFARSYLEESGHAVTLAASGMEALEALSAHGFDVVLMDVSMPGMDGMEATRRIRAGEVPGADRAVPIVALTAHAIKGDRERFLAVGMDGYVSKPVDIAELGSVLGEVLRGRGRVADQPEAAGEFDRVWQRRWFQNKEKVLGTLLALFRDELPKRLGQLRQALAAGQMHEAVELAHTLKSSAAVVGASAVRRAAIELEQAARDGHGPRVVAALSHLEQTVDAALCAMSADLNRACPE